MFKPPSVAGSASSLRSSVLCREAYVEAKLARLELDHAKERQREEIDLDQACPTCERMRAALVKF